MCAIAAFAIERSTATDPSTSEALRAAFRQVHMLRFVVRTRCRDTLLFFFRPYSVSPRNIHGYRNHEFKLGLFASP